jgi:hypothetical protein
MSTFAWLTRGVPGHVFNLGKRSVATTANCFASAALYHAVRIGRRASQRRLEKGVPRSLWGVTPILTLPLKARADRALGFQSHSLVFGTYYIASDFDFNLRKRMEWLQRHAGSLIVPFERLLLAWAIWRYDVFHFFYDRGLMCPVTRYGVNPKELELLRASGKRIYLYAYGADVRRRAPTLALGKWNFCSDCPEPGRFCACDDAVNEQLMAAMCAKATAAVALGDMLSYVPNARNMHYWPIDLDHIPLAAAQRFDGPLKIAHAPNHSHFKGSHYLKAAIEKLRQKGFAIDLVTVQGVPNAEVIRLFGEADLIADQFIGGAYGYTALEAMARGKPVMTFVRSPDLVEAVDECPLINTTPDTLEEALTWCLAHREQLKAIGAQGRVYVERWHSISAVATRIGQMYEDTACFPEATLRAIRCQRGAEVARRAKISAIEGWLHPFLVALCVDKKGCSQ